MNTVVEYKNKDSVLFVGIHKFKGCIDPVVKNLKNSIYE